MATTYKTWITSWNMNHKKPDATLINQWFDDATGPGDPNLGQYDPDIIVVGIQEGHKAHNLSHYLNGTNAGAYAVIDEVEIGGWAGGTYICQYLSILARQTLLNNGEVEAVQDGSFARRQKTVKKAKVKVPGKFFKQRPKGKTFAASTGNPISRLFSQNKGGVASLIRIGRAHIGFITLHIESKDGSNTIRKGEVADLVNETRRLCVQATGGEPDGLFIMGDFNYRLKPNIPMTNRRLAEALSFDRTKLWALDTFGKPGYYPFDALDGTDGPWVFPKPETRPGSGIYWPPSYKWNKDASDTDTFTGSGQLLAPPTVMGHSGPDYDRTSPLYLNPINKAKRTLIDFKDKKPNLDALVEANDKRGGEYDLGWLDRIGYSLSLANPICDVANVRFKPCNTRSATFLKASDHMAVCLRVDLSVAGVNEQYGGEYVDDESDDDQN